MAEVTLTYNDQTHVLEVLKVEELPFPVLLGRDFPGFSNLVRSTTQNMALLEAEEDDTLLGSSSQSTDAPDRNLWEMDPVFLHTQQTGLMLDHLHREIVVSEGSILDRYKASR